MKLVIWPRAPVEGDPGISWMELAMSFILRAKCIIPVKRKFANQTERLLACETWNEAAAHNISLAELGHTFSVWTSQLRKLVGHDVWPQVGHGFTKALYKLGAASQPAGFLVRPCCPMQEETIRLLANYVQQFRGFVATFTVDNFQSIPIHQEHFRLAWNQKLKDVAKAFTSVRRWRAMPNDPLQWAAWHSFYTFR